jgi:hypothetical protein
MKSKHKKSLSVLTITALLSAGSVSANEKLPGDDEKPNNTAFFQSLKPITKTSEEFKTEKKKGSSLRERAMKDFAEASSNSDIISEQADHLEYYLQITRNSLLKKEISFKQRQVELYKKKIGSSICSELGAGCGSLVTEVNRLEELILQLNAKIKTPIKGE